ncbi:hypothetical protein BC830DRAFT_1065000, partial [Chytriomyces sp. MP71]
DILDMDWFWKEELIQMGKRKTFFSPCTDELYERHEHAFLKVVEAKDKRFVRIRKPRGNSG